jgi:hypothetical protein
VTWKNPPKLMPTKSKPAKIIMPEDLAASGSEDGHQAAVFAWAAMNVDKYPQLKWLHAIPNGGQRYIAEASKMVAAGLRKGVLDIFLPHGQLCGENWGAYWHGCYLELKIESRRKQKNGGLTEEQIEFMEYCGQAGYYCKVCYGWIEARDTLVNYLEGRL